MIWVVIGNVLLIFCLRLVAVSLGTMRMIMVGSGRSGMVDLITTIVPRRDVKAVFQLINQTDPKSFIAVDDMKDVKRGYMHVTK